MPELKSEETPATQRVLHDLQKAEREELKARQAQLNQPPPSSREPKKRDPH